MKNIMDWMITEKIAKNDFNASAIVNGLELYKISVSCKHDGCQEGHFCYGFTPAQYVQTDSGGYWIDEDYEWGACECCEGKNYAACPKCSDETRKTRVRLYRDWRNAGEKSKIAFEHAIKGDVIQALPIEGALLSSAMPLWNVTYYTLSDCKASKDIRAKTGSEAEKVAREKDETFDRLIGVSIILEAA